MVKWFKSFHLLLEMNHHLGELTSEVKVTVHQAREALQPARKHKVKEQQAKLLNHTVVDQPSS